MTTSGANWDAMTRLPKRPISSCDANAKRTRRFFRIGESEASAATSSASLAATKHPIPLSKYAPENVSDSSSSAAVEESLFFFPSASSTGRIGGGVQREMGRSSRTCRGEVYYIRIKNWSERRSLSDFCKKGVRERKRSASPCSAG